MKNTTYNSQAVFAPKKMEALSCSGNGRSGFGIYRPILCILIFLFFLPFIYSQETIEITNCGSPESTCLNINLNPSARSYSGLERDISNPHKFFRAFWILPDGNFDTTRVAASATSIFKSYNFATNQNSQVYAVITEGYSNDTPPAEGYINGGIVANNRVATQFPTDEPDNMLNIYHNQQPKPKYPVVCALSFKDKAMDMGLLFFFKSQAYDAAVNRSILPDYYNQNNLGSITTGTISSLSDIGVVFKPSFLDKLTEFDRFVYYPFNSLNLSGASLRSGFTRKRIFQM
ncbi:MAG: hypothetical protein IT258_03770, partial [Saprospiraceae bacterium]|nr:hypothetical protein [Saprospiraceae bacterium]